MQFRKITPTELALAWQHAYELSFFHTAIEVARDFYGPNVYKVEVEIDGQYDDEGGTDWNVSHLYAEDKDGNHLNFDPTTEWWQERVFGGNYYGYTFEGYTPDPFDQDELEGLNEDAIQELLEAEFHDEIYDRRYEINVQQHGLLDLTVYVDQPPQSKYAELYVPVEA